MPKSENTVEKAKKSKKAKAALDEPSIVVEAAPIEVKKEKKLKKKSKIEEGEKSVKRKRDKSTLSSTGDKPPKKRRKEKPASTPPLSDASEDTAVLDEDAAPPREVAEEPAAPDNPLDVDKFPLSPAVKAALRTKQIASLFDIQAQTLAHVLAGKDLLGRARTGCGKTLAFVLPIVETLAKTGSGEKSTWGRLPRVIVLAPTRELAKQVHADFSWIGEVFGLSCACIYGGAPYGPQEHALKRGADIVIGTPGRVKDMLEKGSLKLTAVRFRVLDECDEMLNMGFVDDVERILNAGGAGECQTLLFSATLPPWVKDIQRRFLQPGFVTVDLVGNQKQKASTSVQHLLLPCHWTQRPSVAADCVRTYGAMGRTIVFTDTKRDANDMTVALEGFGARPLHGDIPQTAREGTLAGFRAGKFKVLVATDVAARGLDISGVELVLQCEPPKDPENYIHRSGRTGRAGCTGISLTLVDRKKEGLIPYIERRAGLAFERVGAPQPADMARLAGSRAADALKDIDDGVVPHFRAAAEGLLEQYDDPAEALARALAMATGQTKLQARSILTSHEDFTTLMYHAGARIHKPGQVWTFLRRRLPDATVEEIQRLTLTADDMAAVFDVPSKHAKEFLEKYGEAAGAKSATNLARGVLPATPYLTAPTKLPALKQREGHQASEPAGGGGGGGRRYGGSSGGRGSSFGSRGRGGNAGGRFSRQSRMGGFRR